MIGLRLIGFIAGEETRLNASKQVGGLGKGNFSVKLNTHNLADYPSCGEIAMLYRFFEANTL